jgi:tetratricopeptide (TPR) repeat protein
MDYGFRSIKNSCKKTFAAGGFFQAGGKVVFAFLFWSLFTPLPQGMATDEGVLFQEQLQKAETFIKNGRSLEAIEPLQEAIKLGGTPRPPLAMRLGLLYYDLGMLPEAIAEGEKAVVQDPSSKWYKYNLAKFYYADKQFAQAEKQFIRLLKQDPGFTLGYSYLAELYCRQKEYDMAWLSYQRGGRLGFQGKQLQEKLSPLSKKPDEDFSAAAKNTFIVRFFKAASETEAMAMLEEISQGKLFENLELEKVAGASAFGFINDYELPDSLGAALENLQPYSPPIALKNGAEVLVVQRIAAFDPLVWRKAIAAPQTARAAAEPNTSADLTVPGEREKRESRQDTKGEGGEPAEIHLAAYHALENWRNAWQAGDVKRYLAAYSSHFIPPDDMDLHTWKQKRISSLTRPKFIRVTIKDPVVELLTDHHLLITFTQDFQSDRYQDTVVKMLTLIKEKGDWKISDERAAKGADL